MKYFILIGLLVFIWGFLIEPNILTVKKITLQNKNLAGMKIVFASDLHVKPYDKLRLKRIVKKINEQNADIVLLGGDYVNGHKRGNTYPYDKLASELGELQSKYGTFGVIGNHDGWQGKYTIMKAFLDNNIKMLENENIKIANLTIAGVADLQTGKPDVTKALQNAGENVILLTHSPDVFEEVPDNVALTLAGHTHGGQVVIPFRGPVVVPSQYGTRYAYGLKEKNGRKIFITRGLGTSILPVRFNCMPEIVVINFTK